MGARYTTTALSGYNSNPADDDGSLLESNRIYWSTLVKTELFDPLKTQCESIDTKLTAMVVNSVEITSDTTLTSAYEGKVVEVNSASTVTVTLGAPSSMGAGYIVTIKKTGSGTVIISGTMDGVSSITTTASYDSYTLQVNSVATAYLIISGDKPIGETVVTSKILDANVTAAKFANSSVTSTKFPTSAITNTELGAASITSEKIYYGGIIYTSTEIIDALTYWYPPAGIYAIGNWQSYLEFQIYVSAAWQVNSRSPASFVADGTNVRIYNSSSSINYTLYYLIFS